MGCLPNLFVYCFAGTDIVANGNQSDWISKQVDPHPLVVLGQASVLPNTASNVQTLFVSQ